ncbi:MAG: carbonic anhydrase family protein [Anaerolineae bacterium]|nr:carbonic anhydrase family protein [Anaerolineae bacterium]
MVQRWTGDDWSYEGTTGPIHWGDLAEDFSACVDGTAQSPINITGAIHTHLPPIRLDYHPTHLAIFNTGRTIQVNVDVGSCIWHDNVQYDLIQFHFHHPSEHTIEGVRAPMEVHFVHQNAQTQHLAVVGVLLGQGEHHNPAYDYVFKHLPKQPSNPKPSRLYFDLNAMLPTDTHYYTYQGSLTTPPCSETVRWLLLTTPLGETNPDLWGDFSIQCPPHSTES